MKAGILFRFGWRIWILNLPSVLDQAKASYEHGNFGYGRPPAQLIDRILKRSEKLYEWRIDPAWIVWLPGMVCALNVTCRSLLEQSSQAIIQTPIYPPFLTASKNFDLPLTKVPLLLKDNRFTIDFQSLENLPTKPGICLCFAIPIIRWEHFSERMNCVI